MWTGAGAPHSKGMLDESRARRRDAVETLVPDVADGWDVVVVEPTDAVMLQTDYHDLLDGDASDVPDADVATVSANTYGVMEYVDAHRLDEDIDLDAPTESLTYHGHCHQKATKKDHHAVGVLRRAGVRGRSARLLLLWDGGLVRLRGRALLDEQGDRPDPLRSGRRERR